jgi:hypothetical protein
MPNTNEPGVPRPKGKTAGSGKWTKYAPKQTGSLVHWDEVSAPLIGELVQAVTRDGSAILLGMTRDGGAYVITVCAGDERIKFYAKDTEELARHIANLISVAEE